MRPSETLLPDPGPHELLEHCVEEHDGTSAVTLLVLEHRHEMAHVRGKFTDNKIHFHEEAEYAESGSDQTTAR